MKPETFEIILPPEVLRPYVRRFMYAHTPNEIDVTLSPTPVGFNYLGHIYSGEVYGEGNGQANWIKTKFHFFGQIYHEEINVRYRGKLIHLLAEFTPTGLYRLLNIRGAQIRGTHFDVETVDPNLAAQLEQKIQGSEDRDSHVKMFSSFLRSMISTETKDLSHLDTAVDLINAAQGRILVSDLCERLEMNERTLNRQFQDIVGLSPKHYARVVQLNTVVGMIMGDDEVALAELAQKCGFHDQPHFNKMIKEFFAQNPRAFLNSEHPFLYEFVAKSRLDPSC